MSGGACEFVQCLLIKMMQYMSELNLSSPMPQLVGVLPIQKAFLMGNFATFKKAGLQAIKIS